jgi:xanthine dehydrogenase accessory factor
MPHDWLSALADLDRAGEPAALVTVLAVRGSAPREAGCKMVVTCNAQFGSIGGGNLEFACIATARDLLAGGVNGPVQRDFPLGPALGQCCGGHVSVLFELVRPVALQVALFGAGHVGQALVRLLDGLPCRVLWFDSRPGAFPADRPPGATCSVLEAPDRSVADLPPSSFVLVMTHDHAIDFSIVEAALRRDDFMGIGLIGSATKRARFTARLRRQGMSEAALQRLICPIGVPGIHSKLPQAIAVAVAAQILQALPATTNATSREQAVRTEQRATAGPGCDRCQRAGIEACR